MEKIKLTPALRLEVMRSWNVGRHDDDAARVIANGYHISVNDVYDIVKGVTHGNED